MLKDLTLLAKGVLDDLEVSIEKVNGIINVGNLATLEVEPQQISILFQNLISNALKYHRKGVPPVINLTSLKNHAGNWEIRVEDNGIGFEEKYKNRIFQPFERLHGYGSYEGNGIGLAICEKIVHRHSGTIEVSSIPNIGTTFIVTLPEKQP